MSDGSSQKRREEELYHHAADVLVELGLDGRILYMSDAVQPILMYTAESFIGRSFLEVLVPEDRSATLAAFQKMVATGAEPLTRFRVPRKDGLRVEFEATSRSFRSESGKRRLVFVLRDITQQSAEAAVLKQQAAHYRAIVETGPRPAAILSPAGDIVFSNQAFKAIFGRDIGIEHIFARMSAEARQAIETAWFESNRPERDGSATADFEYQADDGTTAWYATTWHAFQAEDGTRNLCVLYEDISGRKRIEFALQSIADGVNRGGTESVRANLERVARALELDRLVLGGIDPEQPGILLVTHAWQDGTFLEIDRFDMQGLPDETVASGDACIYPAGIAQLIPSVGEKFGHDIQSYAGLPLRRADGSLIGLIGGYGRKPIADPHLTRSLLSTFATHAAAAFDRQLADAEIRANQDRFDVVARQTNELLVEVDDSGVITYVSEASAPLFGYSASDLLGRNFMSLTHPDDHDDVRRARQELDEGAAQSFVVARALHANNVWRWVEARVSAFIASDGSRRGLLLCRDITEHRLTELTRELLYRVVQQGTDLYFVCDPDTTLLFANEAAMARVPLTPAQLPPLEQDVAATPSEPSSIDGRRLTDFLTDVDAARLRGEIIPNLTPASDWSGELNLIGDPDGPPIPTEARAFMIAGREDNPRSYLTVTLRDIEARRTTEEALRQSEFKLNQAKKMEAVGRLAGGIAHDFNNLLTAIIGYSDLVLDEVGEDHGARQDIEEILRAAERAGGLTRQLLTFSRRQVLQPESIDLNAIVADVDRMMRRLIGENIELVTLQDGELRLIIADPGQIEQVIVNLVVNARDAMPRGGRLEIETANLRTKKKQRTDSGVLEAGEYVVLRISDTGTGMDEATRSQIFEPFFTTKEAQEGTGLGLASVYGIVSQSGGQIDVETDPGVGTQFTIYFPIARAQSSTTDARAKPRSLSGRETILLVEDAAPVRRLVERTLRKSGYKVLAAESATAALRYCSRNQGPIDLILTDVVLPKTAGPEIARRAEELRPGIRVLFMSGFADDTLARHGLDRSRAELIEKPFTPIELLTRIRTVLDDPIDASPEASSKSADTGASNEVAPD